MASTFDIFRKNQRIIMAGLVLVAIATFVVAPTIQYMQNSQMARQSEANEPLQGTLVEWRGGSVNSRQFRLLNYKSRAAYDVIQQLMDDTRKAGGNPQFPLQVPFPNGVDNVQRKILAQKGQDLGIVIDDATIDELLRQLVDGRVSKSRFREILKDRETSADTFSRFDLYEFLKETMVAGMVREVALTGVVSRDYPIMTPSRNWQTFLRFRQQQKIEAFPIAVDDMIASVTQKPTEAELKALYESGSNRYPNKTLPDPGFREPYQADVEYVSVSVGAFIEAERKKLTEEEIQKTYADRIQAGRYQVPDEKAISPPNAEPGSSEAGTPPATMPNETATTPESSTNQSSTPPGAAPASNPSGIATPDAGEPPAPPTTDPPKQSSLRANTVYVSTSQEPAVTPPTATPPANQPPADAAPATTPVPAAETPATDSPAIQPPAADQPPVSQPPADGTSPSPEPPTQKMRTQTLDEVREEMTREMVFATAMAKKRAAEEAVKKALYDHSEKMQMYYQAEQMKGNKIERPTAIDLAKICQDNGLTYGRTGLFDSQNLDQLEIAKSRKIAGTQSVMFGEVALYGIQLFQVENTKSFLNGEIVDYYFWKVDERKESLPDFSQIKEKVESAWIRIEARKLAQKRAESLASQAESTSEKPWEKLLSETERPAVLSPGSFTWMQSGMPPTYRPQISYVDQLDLPGFDFMKQVCEAPAGKFVVAPNQPLTIYYVVRVVDKLPSDEALKSQFAASKFDVNSQTISYTEAENFQTEWIRQVERDMKVNWIVSPNILAQM